MSLHREYRKIRVALLERSKELREELQDDAIGQPGSVEIRIETVECGNRLVERVLLDGMPIVEH